jgi:hypothetical protein
MVLRWVTLAFEAASDNFRRIMGHQHLWMRQARIDEHSHDQQLVPEMNAGQRPNQSQPAIETFQLAIGHHLETRPFAGKHLCAVVDGRT